MYSAAPKGAPACSSRNTVKSVFGGRPEACTSKVSKPSVLVVRPTSMFTRACGMQPANVAEDGVSFRCTSSDPPLDDDDAAALPAATLPTARVTATAAAARRSVMVMSEVLSIRADKSCACALRTTKRSQGHSNGGPARQNHPATSCTRVGMRSRHTPAPAAAGELREDGRR